jgi:hypothetical protein
VLEVKAAITSTERLDQALENICSVKSLDRTNEGKNYTLEDRSRGHPVDRDSFKHQIFGAIVTPPLYMLAAYLVDFFRIAPTIDFDVNSYIPLGERRGDSWPIDQ